MAPVDSKSLRMKFPGKGQDFTTLLGGGLAVFLFASAAAQDGYYGVGHDKWHQNFYSKLKRNDGQGSCCNVMDCRPTRPENPVRFPTVWCSGSHMQRL